MKAVFLSVLALLVATVCDGARILVLIPYNARSHYIVMEPLLLALHARGHHLTVVSSFKQTKPLQNYRDIDLSYKLPTVVSNYTLLSIKDKMPNLFKSAIFITEIHLKVCEDIMREEKLVNLLNEKFDLVIGEIFGADCFNYFAHKLKAPLISWVTSTALPWMAERTGLPDNPAYIPNYFVDFNAHMSFLQRLLNTVTLLYAKAAYYYFSDIPSHRLAQQVFNETLPSMDEVNRQTSLVFVNSHLSLSQSRPFPPNVIEVGGIHIKEVQPLSKDLKNILDNSKDGVILFSFGSLVRVSSLPKQVIRMFMEVFTTMPQQVIFKYEEDLPEAPANVIIRKWLPQADIIAHPNVRVVVTHCGLASTTEAVHFAKPLVGVPFFSDQYQNAKNVVRRGGGLLLDIDNLSQRDISSALTAVLEDPSYAENMKKLSLQFRDRPMTALQTAVFWTEYVIRHQGAPHLRPASVSLPLYQYLLVDVIAVILACLAVLLCALYFTFHHLCSLICGGKRSDVQKQKVKKSKKVN